MRKIKLFFIALFVLTWVSAMAVPAKPGFKKVTQSDGTTLTIESVGDEWFCLKLTTDGLVVDRGEDGNYYYVTTSGMTDVRAHDEGQRDAQELSFIDSNKEMMTASAMQEAGKNPGRLRNLQGVSPKDVNTLVPKQGTVRIPVLLVDFKDKRMANCNDTAAFRKKFMNLGEKSVKQYFLDQSNEKLNLEFEIFGVYTLSNNRSYYGDHITKTDYLGRPYTLHDQRKGIMVAEAIKAAEDDVRWSEFCNSSTSAVDLVMVVCAGISEAQNTSNEEAIWPCEWSLTDAASYETDGVPSFTVEGPDGKRVRVNKFSVVNELYGTSERSSNTKMDGIGTYCHEFSHCLGLPDFYDTKYTGNKGMADWSIMGFGNYKDDSETPIGYSAYEKNYMSWLKLEEPVKGQQQNLTVSNRRYLGNGVSEDKAYKITGNHPYEFWVLENRQSQGWDTGIRGGVLITHFTYDPDRWGENTVNSKTVELATVIPADGSLKHGSYIGDTYPYDNNNSFTSTSDPAMKANMYSNGSIATTTGGAGTIDKPVTDITNNGDDTYSFYYMKSSAPELPKLATPTLNAASNVQTTSFTASWTHTSNYGCTYTLNISKNGVEVREVKNINAKSLTVDNLISGATYTFKVKAVPTNSDALESDWSTPKQVTLEEVHIPAITATPTTVSFTGFVSESYTQKVNVTGAYLSQDIAVSLNDASGDYSIDKTTIGKTDNAELTITWSPKTAGTSNASIILSSDGAQAVTINISGVAQPATPTITLNTDALTFASAPSVPKSKTITVTGRFLTNNVSVALNNPNGVFSVSPTTIDAASLANGNSVDVTVTFASENVGNFTGALTLSSPGAESKTISLTASTSDGGNANDAYLDIAKYFTISEAGAEVEDMNSIYKYTEYPDDGIAWLTISNYGVVNVAASQNWITNEIEETYTVKNGWAATDIFLGHKSYFGDDATNGHSAKWRTAVNSTVSQFFYVTNCTQVKQLARNNLINSDNLYMYIYECTKNADGSLNEGTTPIDVQKSYTADVPEVLTSCDLEAEKIYKVEIRNSFSHLYEIGFKTELNSTPVITPVLTVTPDSLAFETYVGEAMAHTFTVTGENISSGVSLISSNDKFTVSPATIEASDLAGGNSVNVTVTFAPQAQGSYSGNLTITTDGAQSKTVALNGEAIALALNAPSALAATSIGTNNFTANWNADPCVGATSYTLRVVHESFLLKPKPTTSAVLKLTETFDACNASNDEITDAYTDNPGWLGTRVYIDDKAVRVGGSSVGSLVSPGVDLSNSNGKVSIKFNAKTYSKPGNYQYQSADNPLKISCGSESQTIIVPSTTSQEFTVVLSCDNAQNQKITFANTKAKANVIISDINIYSGDINATSGIGHVVVVQRDTTVYTGITDNNFKVTGLLPRNNYTYDVKAVYGDQESAWSNSVSVLTKKRYTPLDDLIINGRVGNEFIINDDLIIVHVNAASGQVWCKDQGNASIDATEMRDGQIDFLREVTHEQTKDWDQSNWIMLQFPADDGNNGIMEMLENAEGKTITGGSVYGIYSDELNYTLTVLPENNAYSLSLGDYASYEKNLYCTANFVPSNLNVNGGNGALGRINGEDVYYFFMNPKIQEVCEITAAEFNGDGTFVVPASNNMINGALKVDWSYNALGTQWPEKGKVYRFTAVVNRVATGHKQDASSADSYIVYPLDFDANGSSLTGIGTIDGCREAIGVEYVNVAGLVSDKPFKGVNIVVTRYSDGSSTVVKKLYK